MTLNCSWLHHLLLIPLNPPPPLSWLLDPPITPSTHRGTRSEQEQPRSTGPSDAHPASHPPEHPNHAAVPLQQLPAPCCPPPQHCPGAHQASQLLHAHGKEPLVEPQRGEHPHGVQLQPHFICRRQGDDPAAPLITGEGPQGAPPGWGGESSPPAEFTFTRRCSRSRPSWGARDRRTSRTEALMGSTVTRHEWSGL